MNDRSPDSLPRQEAQCAHETGPLLPQVPITGLERRISDQANSHETEETTISPRKLKWIMASVWIGTFCAGLGEQPHIVSSLKAPTHNHASEQAELIRIANTHTRWNINSNPRLLDRHGIPLPLSIRLARDNVPHRNGSYSAPKWETDRYLLTEKRTSRL